MICIKECIFLLMVAPFKLKKKVDKKRQNETESEYRDRLIEGNHSNSNITQGRTNSSIL